MHTVFVLHLQPVEPPPSRRPLPEASPGRPPFPDGINNLSEIPIQNPPSNNPFSPLPSEVAPLTEAPTTAIGLVVQSLKQATELPATTFVAWLSLTTIPVMATLAWLMISFTLLFKLEALLLIAIVATVGLFLGSGLLIGSSFQYELLKKTRILPPTSNNAHMATLVLVGIQLLAFLPFWGVTTGLLVTLLSTILGIPLESPLMAGASILYSLTLLTSFISLQGNILLIFHETPSFRPQILLEATQRSWPTLGLSARALMIDFSLAGVIFLVFGATANSAGIPITMVPLLFLTWILMTATWILILIQQVLIFPHQPPRP